MLLLNINKSWAQPFWGTLVLVLLI